MDLQNSGWLDHHWMQSKRWNLFNRIPLYSLHDYQLTPARPTLFMEGLYEDQDNFGMPEGEVATAYHNRLQGWSSLLSGAAGTIYGHDKGRGGNSYEPELLKKPGAEDFKHLSTFFRNIEWWRLVPHHEWILMNGQFIHLLEDDRLLKPFLAAIPNELYVAYIPDIEQNTNLTITDLGRQPYMAKWYNPRNGNFTPLNNSNPIQPNQNGDWAVPAAPDGQDWVIVLKAGRE